MNASEELERGRLATEVLENPVYMDAFGQIEQEVLRKWQSEEDQSEREWLWTLMQASKRFQALLVDTMQTGKLRSRQIEQDQSRLAKLGRTLRMP